MAESPGILAIVPARRNSKRLPGKNMLALGGRPLVSWTLEAALAAGVFSRIVVTSDDPRVLDLAAARAGLEVHARPAALATDTATSVDVIMDVLDAEAAAGREYAIVVLLQPTSPFRSAQDIVDATLAFSRSGKRHLVSVCALDHPLHWCGHVAADGSLVGIDASAAVRSQDLPQSVRLNGAIYVSSPAALRESRSFLDGAVQAFPMPRERSPDIDTALDLALCQALLSLGAADRAGAA